MTIIQNFLAQLNQNSLFQKSGQDYFKKQVNLHLKPTILKNQNYRQALIIGAGKMSDFSLSFFVRFFDKVVVTDIDIESCKDYVKSIRLTKEHRQKIVFKRIEYTGFEDANFFSKLDEQVLSFKTRSDVDIFLSEINNQIRHYQFLEDQTGSYDFIYVSPIYTQLIYQLRQVPVTMLQ